MRVNGTKEVVDGYVADILQHSNGEYKANVLRVMAPQALIEILMRVAPPSTPSLSLNKVRDEKTHSHVTENRDRSNRGSAVNWHR